MSSAERGGPDDTDTATAVKDDADGGRPTVTSPVPEASADASPPPAQPSSSAKISTPVSGRSPFAPPEAGPVTESSASPKGEPDRIEVRASSSSKIETPPPPAMGPRSTPPEKIEINIPRSLTETQTSGVNPLAMGGGGGIMPRRLTPNAGTPAQSVKPSAVGGGIGPIIPRRITPAAGMPATPRLDIELSRPPTPGPIRAVLGAAPPIIREPKDDVPPSSSLGNVKGAGGSMLCEILLRNGAVSQVMVDKAIALQEEQGGQIGRILVRLGACTEEQIAKALIDQLKQRSKRGHEDISVAARENKEVAGLRVLTRPVWTSLTLVMTDLFSLSLAAALATTVHFVRLQEIDWSAWLVVGPSVLMCMLVFLGLELFSPMAKSTPDEIRDIVFGVSLVHFGASILSTLGDLPIVKWGVFVRLVWWAATLFLVPVIRGVVRGKLCTKPWWGIPVCVLGAAKTGRLVVRMLKAQPKSGMKPVMLLDDDPNKHGTLRASFTNEVMDVYSVNVSAAHFLSESQRRALSDDIFGDDDPPSSRSGARSSARIPLPPTSFHSELALSDDADDFLGPESVRAPKSKPAQEATWFPRGKFAEVEGVPVVGDLSLAPVLAKRLKIPYAVVAMPGVDSHRLLGIVERVGGKFSHLLLVPDLFGFATLGVPAKNLGGVLAVEVRQQLLLPGPRLAKRVMDSTLTLIGIFFVLPFLVLIALLIKLDSRGPIFYTQKRMGRDGEHFDAYKFRSMHGDGEERLKSLLENDPALKAEYEIYHKLKKDPRVTRVGRILRKFSLDEFPQLINVVKGDMSLVGPRPYLERELAEMSGQEKIILRATPGMTGMWQVSDRNATSFAQRCQIDVYYVRNWSPWLDIHILAKTFGVVIKGTGM
ncbi:MAG: exopolysaccharide biosynthesis polyprenyl glycosylphosphotransferase [Myxococcales bacterium]|nr:exopolysaccharide biosynthesis polyprenyl glycosylphosphotransferase [Myxococcales bacterium]